MKHTSIPGINLTTCKILHDSKKEKIYLTPDYKVIKICKNLDECRREYLILRYCQNNKYFPKVYEYHAGYIIREYISGICLIDYIKKQSIDESLVLSLVDLIENFKLLHFTRLDTGISHIFINKNGTLKVIGLKNNYLRKEKYPKHMISGLRKLKVSKKFFKVLKKQHPDLYQKWKD
ncbi:serine/threonine protein kinase [Clostridium ganghwense]|uniref:Serine/threonine protein kinase n=1 Tax=Clostridium ganghwense TaxID=312089 RepID=A0ABT4CNF3_9CLOT|nr:serine/threonine protein kinase [Clostridium ganghwense]MCY6370585.1 serine/threonine protein kinase [Clostridium ganghwense]